MNKEEHFLNRKTTYRMCNNNIIKYIKVVVMSSYYVIQLL